MIDCRSIEGTNCYLDPDAQKELQSMIAEVPLEDVHWIDSGDYHYMSRLLTDRVRTPFQLIVFDNHPDMQEPVFPGVLSCGSWVRSALETNTNLKKVFLIGTDPELDSETGGFAGRVTLLKNTEKIPLEPLPVYISIDKDVLSDTFARTDWTQGDMTLDSLLKALSDISESTDIIGIDVCGALPPSKGGTAHDLQINSLTDSILHNLLKEL